MTTQEMTRVGVMAVVCWGAAAALAFAQPASGTTESDVAALRARIDALAAQMRALENELGSGKSAPEQDSAPGPVKPVPTIAAATDGFQLRSADDSFVLKLRGLVQSDGRFFIDDRSAQAADTFLLRRVRPILDGTVFRFVDFRLMPDFGGGTTVLQDAYVDLRFHPFARVRVGKQKQPFGLERLVSASALPFIERALPTAVAGNRDIGVMLYGDGPRNRVSYWAGLFNGVADGASADVDDRDGKDVVGRVMVHPFRGTRHARVEGLGAGFAASYGSERRGVAAPGLPTYRSSGQQTFFRYRGDGTAAGTVLADGTRYRLSAQGYLYTGQLGLLAEQVFSSQSLRRENASGRMGTGSWQAMATWVLTGERASASGLTPRAPFEPSAGRLGAVELTARYHQLTADRDAFPAFADPLTAARAARAWTTGVNWYLNRSVKVTADYEQTRFTGGAPVGDRPTEHDVLTRVQLAF